MPTYSSPSIDSKNPLYCPSVPAAVYLDSIRRRLRRNRSQSKPSSKFQHNDYFLRSFSRILDNALLLGDSDDEDSRVFPPRSRTYFSHHKEPSTSPDTSQSEENPLGFEYAIPSWEHDDTSDQSETLWVGMRGQPVPTRPPGLRNLKRKRTSFSDIQGPTKHGKSFQSVHESSFDVSVKHEKLQYSGFTGLRPRLLLKTIKHNAESTPHIESSPEFIDDPVGLQFMQRIRTLEDELYGSPIGTESPRGIKPLVDRLDNIFPGTRMRDRLSMLENLSHQTIVDFLADHGYLNAPVMNIFRTSEVQQIVLTESLLDKNGLNLSANGILPVFAKPNSFLFLSELSLSGTPVHDFDITHINRLPQLSTLILNDTAISNEAVFLLVPLKRSLAHLCIAINPQITDDAVPALLLLSKLTFLSILDTNINMPGLRRLARTIFDENRVIDIEIPTACEQYVDNMHTKYLLNPRPPLIANAQVCAQLSIAALQRNLVAHAQVNPAIVTTGSKEEMTARLEALLEMRKMDMLVRDMILGLDLGEQV